jgi:hypothetical protein
MADVMMSDRRMERVGGGLKILNFQGSRRSRIGFEGLAG